MHHVSYTVHMRSLTTLAVLLPVVLMSTANAQNYTIGDLVEGQLHDIEAKITSLATAVPPEVYSFAPSRGEFKGARTFGEQLKHVASTNLAFAHALMGKKSTLTKFQMLAGPSNIHSKAEVLSYLADSFAQAHRAAKSVTDRNFKDRVTNPVLGSTMSRLVLANLMFSHAFDHYGQMVIYARMNRIIPPDSGKPTRSEAAVHDDYDASLMQADRDWATTVAKGDMVKYPEFIADDAMFVDSGRYVTRTEMINNMKDSFSDSLFSVRNAAERGAASQCGDLGYTAGWFDVQDRDKSGRPLAFKGKYVDVWQRDQSGKWKVILDISSPIPTREGPKIPD